MIDDGQKTKVVKAGEDKGWLPDPESDKDFDFAQLAGKLKAAATGDVDLRPYTSPRHNQRWTKSCVAQAVIKALEIKRIIKYGAAEHVDLSILQLWYLARELMFPPRHKENSGTFIRLACDCLRRFGAAPSNDWPWNPDKLDVSPPWSAMRKAYLHRISAYYRIGSTGDERVADVVSALRSSNPVVFGTATGDNWHSYRRDDVLEVPDEQTGRHATVLVGFIDGNFVGENSWGNGWGDDGFYLMDPKVIASKHSADFWVMTGSWEVLS